MPLSISVRRADAGVLDTALLVVVLGADAPLPDDLGARASGRASHRGGCRARRDFRGGRDETLHLSGGAEGVQRLLLVGTGKGSDRTRALKRAASIAARQAARLGVGELTIHAGDVDATAVENITVGLIAGSWEYADLKTPPSEDERRKPLTAATILVRDEEAGRRGLAGGESIGAGHSLARRLAMMPGNLCTPDFLADSAREIAERYGMQLTVLGRREMEEQKMGSFLSVAQGTPQDPKLIVLEYRRKNGDKPLVLIGKGLCFDTGGISIKPAERMEAMKFDMCGAAGVLGAMETIGRLGLAVNVVGIIGATTNMPSGTAIKPGDVVQSHLGKFIEIINTDAEGRLVLADLLSYARRFEPAAAIDAATLTGACVIALGNTTTGVFGSDDALITEVLAAGQRAGEPGWSMPMWDDYKDLIKSDVADVKNTGGRAAGSITAALFLKEFVEGFPWVHLDIAGTAYSESDLVAIPKGPTGVPVGTFVEFVRGRTG
jgi:leucyl aminopeptidase